MNEFLIGTDLIERLTVLPAYNDEIRKKPASERILATSDIYNIFVPNETTIDIYSKVYKMTYLSLQKKGTKEWVKATKQNRKYMQSSNINTSCGVITGLSSSTIIGSSGVGKTASVMRSIELIGGNETSENTKNKVVPVLMIQTPFDCSYKTLLLEILNGIDKALDTDYVKHYSKSSATANQMLGTVSQVCQNFIGLLVIDEIQNIVEHRAGRQLYRLILQLINTSCNVLMVGTPECRDFFTQDTTTFQFARRSVGIECGNLPFDEYFVKLCKILLNYNYLQNDIEVSDTLTHTLYSLTNGNISVLISLIQVSQEDAILKGYETLTETSLKKVFKSQFGMINDYVEKPKSPLTKSKTKHSHSFSEVETKNTPVKISDLVSKCKSIEEAISQIQNVYPVEKVRV